MEYATVEHIWEERITMTKKKTRAKRQPSPVPSGTPLIKGAILAAALVAPGCQLDEDTGSTTSDLDIGSHADHDMELEPPMMPPMVIGEQDTEIATPMPSPNDAGSLDDVNTLPPMPEPNDDMEVESDLDLPPMPPPMPAPSDAEVFADMAISPPMAAPEEDMAVEQDRELPPMPPPMPPPRDAQVEEDMEIVPPMPRPQTDMAVEQDRELPPMPPPMPPPRDNDADGPERSNGAQEEEQ